MPSRILIADDQTDILEALRLLLKRQDYAIETVTSAGALLEVATERQFDLILMDMNYARDTTSGREGMDLLAQLNRIEDSPPIVVMTGWASIPLAVEAMQQGVGDFVQKPWVNAHLLETVKKQIELGSARREARREYALEKATASEANSQLRQQKNQMAEAQAIQLGFLPRHIPEIAGLEIATAWQPSRIVAGDYFDTICFDERTLAMCIADVAGKGLPAALLMANLQAAVRGMASATLQPDQLCRQLNSLLFHNVGADRFITFFYAALDIASREMCYANAGHNAPVLWHADGSHERLDCGGGVFGIFAEQQFDTGKVKLEPGDRVVLFTDGLTEANNPAMEEFGDRRLLQVLQENSGATAAELRSKLMGAASEFNSNIWDDDATLLILAVN